MKAALGTQSSNLKQSAINRIGRCAGPLDAVCQQFDSVSSVRKPSGKHCRASWKEDVIKIASYKATRGAGFSGKSISQA